MRQRGQPSGLTTSLRRLVLVALTATIAASTASFANMDEMPEEHLSLDEVCGPEVSDTCVVCPYLTRGSISVSQCCREPLAYADCTSAVEGAVGRILTSSVGDGGLDEVDENVEEKRAKYFLGKRAKYFLGKRSFGNRVNYGNSYYDLRPALRHQLMAQDFAYRRPELSRLEKRVKYFLGK